MSFKKDLIKTIFIYPRIWKYKFLSNCISIIGKPIYTQPTQILGNGTIIFGNNVHLGFYPSPYFYNGYIYIEARTKDAKIIIGDDVHINNNSVLFAESAGIEIGSKTLIGTNCEIIDSDGHDLNPDKRLTGTPVTRKIIIGRNVFIGSNVKILKGVTIGDNSVIANGSIVIKSIPKNTIAGGNPAKIIKNLL